MQHANWHLAILSLMSLGIVTACGGVGGHEAPANHRLSQSLSASGDATGASGPRLAEEDTDQVLGTLVIPFGDTGAALTDSGDGQNHWSVDMQDTLPVVGGVAPLKYLKVTGDLHVPMAAADQSYEIGCIYVDLKDNVYFREQTWLRLATNGVKGDKYGDVLLPLSVNMGGWTSVPVLGNSLTLAKFSGSTIKKHTATMCFKLDFANAPADQYKGQIIVQYLRSGSSVNPSSCNARSTEACCKPDTTPPVVPPTPTPVFACSSSARVLKAGEKAAVSWANLPTGASLELSLAAANDTYKGDLGTVVSTGANSASYTAPSQVSAATKIIISAHPTPSELLPTFCSVTLVADGQIGVPDDGALQGLPGNVFVLPANSNKIPDFSALKPLMELVVGNIDVPNHIFSQGFPGVPKLTEWFGIQFKGTLLMPVNQTCSFKLTADDGANLYIDDKLIVNNDGIHPVTDAYGTTPLSQGAHKFRVDYYQGPRNYIALQAAWKCGAEAAYQIIPSSAFSRPLN